MNSKGILLGLGLTLWMAAAGWAQPTTPTSPQDRGWFSEKSKTQRGRGDGQHGQQGQHGRRQQMRKMVAQFDVNHDGRLDDTERAAAIQGIMNNPKVKERLAKHPDKEGQFRERLEKRLSKWHGGQGQGKGKQRRRPQGGSTAPLG